MSARLDADFLAQQFPWSVLNTDAQDDKLDFHITVFDLGIGKHDRVDRHLEAAKSVLLRHEADLNALSGDCKYTLWVAYEFPSQDGSFNIYPFISAAFSFLRTELIFKLKPYAIP